MKTPSQQAIAYFNKCVQAAAPYGEAWDDTLNVFGPADSVAALREMAAGIGSHFVADMRHGCYHYYDKDGAHAFCVGLREVATHVAEDINHSTCF